MLLGCHLSISGGLDKAIDKAEELGINALQIFSRSPRGWQTGKIPQGQVERFKRRWRESQVEYIVIHTIYLINLASPKEELYRRSIRALKEELKRAAALGVPHIVTHVGAHTGMGLSWGIGRVTAALNEIIKVTEDVKLLLENTAGEGTTIGSRFEELAAILANLNSTKCPNCLGICFDTCHGFAAGYDLASEAGVEETVRLLDRSIGLDKLELIHLNDSLHRLGSHKDRHQHIGEGYIGLDGFRHIVNHPAFSDKPFILETPKAYAEKDKLNSDADKVNLERIRSLRE